MSDLMEGAHCPASTCESNLSANSNGAGNSFCRDTSLSAPEKGDVYKIIAAIDFGTTFSGYAYALASEKDSIHTNRNWGQTQGFLLQKTPTCLLLKPSGEFAAFGFDAVSRYNDLTEDEASEHYYFDRFKMKLYDNKTLNSEVVLKDVNGKEQLALDVFSHSLGFMKRHLLHHLTEVMGYQPEAQTIRWVITVPAIWDENAKQFMREAACKGDLIRNVHSHQLLVALEPEAASLTCRTENIKNHRLKPTFEPGTKYIVLDTGGGTIDIVAHKIRKDGKIREVFRATGGAWGGTVIDQKFIDLLYSIFGEKGINEFHSQYPKDYVELLQDFEIKKRGESDNIRVSLPYNFCNFSFDGKSAQNCIKNYADRSSSTMKFSSGKLVLPADVADSLFKETLDKINDHIKNLLKRRKLHNLKYIFLVGGFAESVRLQSSIKNSFSDRVTVLVPEEASLAVVKGAVAFGCDPSSICKRICRYTYGVGSHFPFEDGKHRDDLKFVSGELVMCKNILHIWAKCGEVIRHNEVWRETFTPIIANQKGIIFEFFKSSKKNVQYTDEEGVEKCGCLVVEMPDMTGDKERAVDLEVIFGGTEIKVVGYDHTSKTHTETCIDFLTE